MVDIDDVGGAALYGGIAVFVAFVVWYLVFAVPAIINDVDACYNKGGQIVRFEGNDKCIATDALRVIK